MRTAKEMAKYSHSHNNWQLQGIITYTEFLFIRERLEELSNEIDKIPFWDHAVVDESLFRDRKSVYMRYLKRFKKENVS